MCIFYKNILPLLNVFHLFTTKIKAIFCLQLLIFHLKYYCWILYWNYFILKKWLFHTKILCIFPNSSVVNNLFQTKLHALGLVSEEVMFLFLNIFFSFFSPDTMRVNFIQIWLNETHYPGGGGGGAHSHWKGVWGCAAVMTPFFQASRRSLAYQFTVNAPFLRPPF